MDKACAICGREHSLREVQVEVWRDTEYMGTVPRTLCPPCQDLDPHLYETASGPVWDGVTRYTQEFVYCIKSS